MINEKYIIEGKRKSIGEILDRIDESLFKEEKMTEKMTETIVKDPKITRATLTQATKEIEFITFEVANVKQATVKPSNRVPAEQALRKQLPPKPKIEAWSQTMNTEGKTDLLQYDGNCLIGTVGQCFAEHRPLVLSPDMIWLTILQGFANHINLDPEK